MCIRIEMSHEPAKNLIKYWHSPPRLFQIDPCTFFKEEPGDEIGERKFRNDRQLNRVLREMSNRVPSRIFCQISESLDVMMHFSTHLFPAYPRMIVEYLSVEWLSAADYRKANHKKFHRDHILHQPQVALGMHKFLTKPFFYRESNRYTRTMDRLYENIINNLIDQKCEDNSGRCITILDIAAFILARGTFDVQYITNFASSLGLPDNFIRLGSPSKPNDLLDDITIWKLNRGTNDTSHFAFSFWKYVLYHAMMVAALYHDIGYVVEFLGKIDEGIRKSMHDEYLPIEHPKDILNHMSHHLFMAPFLGYHLCNDYPLPNLNGLDAEKHIKHALKNHGFQSALHFICLNNKPRYWQRERESMVGILIMELAALGMAMHNMDGYYNPDDGKSPNRDLFTVRFDRDPVSFILSLIDFLQHHDRFYVTFPGIITKDDVRIRFTHQDFRRTVIEYDDVNRSRRMLKIIFQLENITTIEIRRVIHISKMMARIEASFKSMFIREDKDKDNVDKVWGYFENNLLPYLCVVRNLDFEIIHRCLSVGTLIDDDIYNGAPQDNDIDKIECDTFSYVSKREKESNIAFAIDALIIIQRAISNIIKGISEKREFANYIDIETPVTKTKLRLHFNMDTLKKMADSLDSQVKRCSYQKISILPKDVHDQFIGELLIGCIIHIRIQILRSFSAIYKSTKPCVSLKHHYKALELLEVLLSRCTLDRVYILGNKNVSAQDPDIENLTIDQVIAHPCFSEIGEQSSENSPGWLGFTMTWSRITTLIEWLSVSSHSKNLYAREFHKVHTVKDTNKLFEEGTGFFDFDQLFDRIFCELDDSDLS